MNVPSTLELLKNVTNACLGELETNVTYVNSDSAQRVVAQNVSRMVNGPGLMLMAPLSQ